MPPGAPPGSGTAFARGAISVGAMRIRVIRHPAAAAIRFHRTAAATSRPTKSSRRASKLIMILQRLHAQLQHQLRAAGPLQILLQPLDVAPFDRPAVVHAPAAATVCPTFRLARGGAVPSDDEAPSASPSRDAMLFCACRACSGSALSQSLRFH